LGNQHPEQSVLPPEDDDSESYHVMTRSKRKAEMARKAEEERRAEAMAVRTASTVDRATLVRVLATKVYLKQALRTGGKHKEAHYKEIQQVLDKKVWHGIRPDDAKLVDPDKIVHHILFSLDKRSGQTKARLSGRGDQQQRGQYTEAEISSPTVTLQSALMIAAIAASEHRDVATFDIVGAYLHCDLKHDVYMRLDKTTAEVVCQLDESYKAFRDHKSGSMLVKLDKALYGLVESAKLFYLDLTAKLTSMGFTVNPNDLCVFNRMVDGVQQTVCFHVDDLMVTCVNSAANDRFYEELNAFYPGLKTTRGSKHTYLGMDLEFKDGVCIMSVSKYVHSILSAHPITNAGSTALPHTPASEDLFSIDLSSPLLSEKDKDAFHSCVAKCLWVSQRRIDIEVPVSFLCSRVQAPTSQDHLKLKRLLGYMDRTKNYAMKLHADLKRSLLYVDAAFAVHPEKRSHSGMFISLGLGCVYASSTKQKLVTLSSTEAEVVAVSDGVTHVIWTDDWLKSQGYFDSVHTSDVYHVTPTVDLQQDNQSAIKLLSSGKGRQSRLRHVHIRHFFIKDRVATGDVAIHYCPTEEMIADLLTKPLDRSKFEKFRTMMGIFDPTVVA
jgi:hypothetical protein